MLQLVLILMFCFSQHYFATYNHAFLKNYRARALLNTLKFGFSECGTLVWIDLLADQASVCMVSVPCSFRPLLSLCVSQVFSVPFVSLLFYSAFAFRFFSFSLSFACSSSASKCGSLV